MNNNCTYQFSLSTTPQVRQYQSKVSKNKSTKEEKEKATKTLEEFSLVLKKMEEQGLAINGLSKQTMREISSSIDIMNNFYKSIKNIVN